MGPADTARIGHAVALPQAFRLGFTARREAILGRLRGGQDQGLEVARGLFGARMQVELANDGPVTIVLDG